MLLALWSAYEWGREVSEQPQRGGGAASGYFYVYNQAVRKKDKEYEEATLDVEKTVPQYIKNVVSSTVYRDLPKPDMGKLFWDSEARKARIADQFYLAFTRYQELESRRRSELDDELTLLILLN